MKSESYINNDYYSPLLTMFLDGDEVIYAGIRESLLLDDVMGIMDDISMLDNSNSYEFLKNIDFSNEYKVALADRILANNPMLMKMVLGNPQ